MKGIFIALLFELSLISVNSQAYNDTLYITRNGNDSNLQVVFIDSPNSKFHKMVFQYLLSDPNANHGKVEHFSQTRIYKKQGSISEYNGDWISIHSYKGKPYAYLPSEPYYNLFIKISDSTIVMNDFNDGFLTYLISKVIRKKSEIIFQLVNSSGTEHTLSLRLTGYRIYEVKSSLLNNGEMSMVKRDIYFEFPIIVNYCPGYRCQEFDFK